ncbi:DNA-binding SARP family transcriptional activator [Friedmanniella endophytica]|uniref:DNA-binding SARP family transcriptional activator n=1 Tax=Microlunatus kandeliicorticis TaxID=1759536 RepID=A0A7W3P475_9ACTN|nr:BTAD domain-containing putative transcriptional regulator [Microlunatus kandeliicorticis]MBA8792586.1 DNA-binding SARP family transcriptional activator [Microlunatus kandeliicorticis]
MLEFAVLGPLEVRRDGVQLPLGPPKQRAVLAVLLLEAGRAVSTDRIVADVWGDDPPGSVLTSLQAYVSNLRRVLRDEDATTPIVRQPPGYRCTVGPGGLDLARFREDADRAVRAADDRDWATAVTAATAALDRWRGPLLADFADENWVVPAVAAAEERRTACRQTLVAGLLGLDRVTEAVHTSAALHADHPLDERACWLHLVALHRAGRTAEALDTYRAHATRLDEELGLEPGPALRDLQGAILRQDAALAGWPGPAVPLATVGLTAGRPPAAAVSSVPPVVEPAPVHAAHPRTTRPAADPGDPSADRAPGGPGDPSDPSSAGEESDTLIGRSTELAALAAVLEPGRTGWAVLEGVAGIGKSRLAQACLARWADAGGSLVVGRCPDEPGQPAWWPLRQVLRDLGEDPDAVLLPPAGVEVDAARFATIERVRAVLARHAAGAGGLLLHLDDVHWADPTTLGFLTVLAQSPPVPGLAVLLTTRPVPAGGDLPQARLLAAVVRASRSRHVVVPPLSPDEVARLADRVSATPLTPAEADALAERTGGNPFFVAEYARLPESGRGAGEIPGAVRSVLDRRLATVDAEVLRVLRVAALVGQTLDVDLLERILRLDRDELADLLDDAADEHLIVAGGDGTPGGYAFVHALMREQVADGLTGLRRQRLHLRIADEVADRGRPEAVHQRAAHLLAALPLGDPAETVAACRAAAEQAAARWQSADAAYWWGGALQALDLLPPSAQQDRGDLVAAQVTAYARSGRGTTAVETVDEELARAIDTGRLEACGRIAVSLLRSSGAWPWAVYGTTPDSVLIRRLEQLTGLLEDSPADRVRVLATLAVGSCYHPDPDVPDRLGREAIAVAERLDDPDALADALLARAITYSGVADRAAEVDAVLTRLAGLPHDQSRLDAVFCHNLGALTSLLLGRVDEAAAHVRDGIAAADELRLPVSRAQLRWIEAELTQWHGEDLDRAAEQFERAWQVHAETELYNDGVFELSKISVAWDRDRLDGLEIPLAGPALFWLRVIVAALQRRPGSVEALTAEIARPEPVIWTTHGRLTLLAHTVADLGLAELAEPLRTRLSRWSGQVAAIGHVGNVGPVDLALARLSRLVGDPTTARTRVAAARELCRAQRASRHLLRARLLDLELALDDRPGEAGGPDPDEVAAVRREAERLGMDRLAARAEALAAEVVRS